MKLLPAAVNPVEPSPVPDVSTSLAPLTQRAISARAGQVSLARSANLVSSANTFGWSSSTRQGGATRIDGTVVEDPQSDEGRRSSWEYVSAWAGSFSVERSAIAHYLFNTGGVAGWSGRLIDLYA